jgi:predicted nucleic acid-binding protein
MVKNKVFLDSSVIISALLSFRGGSFYVINQFKDKFEFQINHYVFEEILEVLREKFSKKEELKNKFFVFLETLPIKILPNPSKKEVKFLEKIINKTDTPILASALKNIVLFTYFR